jgi:A/G-specific adenine glycosylase
MLQQTTVAAVIPYYNRWMDRFPTVDALAEADEDVVLSLWQGLGYYRRARLLLAGARRAAESGLPRDAEGWRGLPGVGAYTAGAICSIALGLPEPLVDGNVERVYARVTGDATPPPALSRLAWEWAARELDRESPGDYNQALMELGATVCTPKNPRCFQCPCALVCTANQQGCQDTLPAKKPRVEMTSLTHYTRGIRCQGRWGFRQIPPGEWWEGLWEMPRGTPESLEDWLGSHPAQLAGTLRHTVTHHRISLHVDWIESPEEPPGLTFLPLEDVGDLAMPSPQRKALRMILEASGKKSGAPSLFEP